MSEDATPRYGLPLLYAGQAQKEIFHNEALAIADLLMQAQALSAALADPPASPAEGDCWIVGDSPGGDWAGHGGELAGWTGGGWRFIAPRAGMRVRVADENLDYVHDGSMWKRGEIRPDGLYVGGVRVVADRQAAIAAPAGGSTVDGEARAAILAILNAMEYHGLIG